LKPRGRIREKLNIGAVLTIVFIVGLLLFLVLVFENPSRPSDVPAAIMAEIPEPRVQPQLGADRETSEVTPSNVVSVEEREVVTPRFADGVIYQLTADAFLQGQSIGASGSGILGFNLMQAGHPTLTIVENPFGGNAIEISDRLQPWYAVDIPAFWLDSLNIEENAYILIVSGKTTPETFVRISGMDDPWNILVNTNSNEDGNFEIAVVISTETLSAVEGGIVQFTQRGFRIQTNCLANFTVHEIMLILL